MRKSWIAIICCWLGFCACEDATPTTPAPVQNTTVSTDSTLNSNFFQEQGANSNQTSSFLPLLDSSYYQNKDSFAAAFQSFYQIAEENSLLEVQSQHLYGAVDSVFWVRFAHNSTTTSCAHPPKEQHFIFNHKGQLLYQNTLHSAQFLANAIDSTPFYLTIEHNCEGEGKHHAYVLQEGQLVNILNVFFENMPLTYDAKEDSSVFQADGALEPLLKDINADGHPDLILKGKKVQLYSRSGKRFSVQRPYRRDPVRYHFIYEPAKEIFIFDPNFLPAR